MNSGTITNQLLDAVQVIVDDAIQKADFDKTIQAIISKCVSVSQGKYLLKYQGGYFYAYSKNSNITYEPNTQVYVLIPENDMSKTKTIVGLVDEISINIEENESDDNIIYEHTGTNVFSDTEGTIYSLHSYLVTDNIILYEYGNNNLSNNFNIDLDGANLYLKNSKYLIIGAKFKTSLESQNRIKGNYGLKYTLTFKDAFSGDDVDRVFILDINSMVGNPYNQPVFANQSSIFEIDSPNFKRIKKIEIFSKDFVTVSNPNKPADIFVSDLELIGASKLTANENNGYILSLSSDNGTYFDDNHEEDKNIKAEIYKNKKLQEKDTEDIAYYWFKENGSIYVKDPAYVKYGGIGWECINTYQTEEETGRRIYDTKKSFINFSKSSLLGKEIKIKCVVIYKNTNIKLSHIISLYNNSSVYEIVLTSSEGTFTNAENTTLTCAVTGAESGHTLNYYWSQKIDNNNDYEEISMTTSNSLLANLTLATEQIIYQCFVKDATTSKDIGTVNLLIIRGEEESLGYYYITINNDMQIFKYDTEGNSPASPTLINPQILNPLSFILYDTDGEIIPMSEIGAENIHWTVPTENTMIINSQIQGTYNEQLSFEIKNKYDPRAINNTIELEVEYDNKIIKNKAVLFFIKEGENGSNGTSYTMKVVPNLAVGASLNGKAYYYYKNSSNKGFNFEFPSGQFPFKTLFYRDGDLIYDSSSSNNNITPTSLSYEILKRTYTSTVYDGTLFTIQNNNIVCANNPSIGTNPGAYSADILKCSLEYNGLVWYYLYPINFVLYNQNLIDNYDIIIPENSGLDEVSYSADGRNPICKGEGLVYIKLLKDGEEVLNFDEDLNIQGQIYTSNWQAENNLLIENNNEIYAKEFYDGNCVTNAIYDAITINNNDIAEIHLPVPMYLNTYGNTYINNWDGNAIELNEEGGIILTPQIAAGNKEIDNTFTGVVGGKAKESTSSTFEEGIFGYNHGVRTFELNAEDGSAKFGASGNGQIVISPNENNLHSTIKSGNYHLIYAQASGIYKKDEVYFSKSGNIYTELIPGTDYQIGDTILGNNIYYWLSGEGLEIDLKEPHIRFGSKKFKVEKDGSVFSSGYNARVGALESAIDGQYFLTKDTNFIADKIYYIKNEVEEYQEYHDYSVGDSIPANTIYEFTEQDSLKQKVQQTSLDVNNQGVLLNIISTNIDHNTGDVLALKRTNYEIGENGIITEGNDGYKAIRNTTGDYFYDNNNMTGKYTKDGSVQKDFALFGKYYYGIDENLDVENFTKDDAMFIAQLYEDANGVECFGHFYNG